MKKIKQKKISNGVKFDILTIFPNALDSYFNSSILDKAQKNKLITIKTHDIRQASKDKRRTVDDKPYGGGPGMVLQIEPVYKTLKKVYPHFRQGSRGQVNKNKLVRVILLSPRGKTFTQNETKRLVKYRRLILIAGHYESIDARMEKLVDETISLGNFVLTGGELAAACIIDSVARLVPGVVGKIASVREESFSVFDKNIQKFNIEYPQYTRPPVFQGLKVPKVLLSGHHGEIKKWREGQSKSRK